MNKTIIATLLIGAFAVPAMAQTAAPAAPEAAPANPLTANIGVVSDYLFRGISQTHGNPALQGGVDYLHASGFYVGVWGSNVNWVKDFQNVSAPVEIDVYGGFKNTFAEDFSYDIGAIAYNYPGSKSVPENGTAKADTVEVYGALGWKWLTAKYSYATSSHFIGWYGGAAGSDVSKGTRGSNYLELNAVYDLGDGWGVTGHVGQQKVKNYARVGDTDASYVDWKIGVTKDVGFGVVGLAYSDTNAKGTCTSSGGTNAYCWGRYNGSTSSNFRDVSKARVLLSFVKTF